MPTIPVDFNARTADGLIRLSLAMHRNLPVIEQLNPGDHVTVSDAELFYEAVIVVGDDGEMYAELLEDF